MLLFTEFILIALTAAIVLAAPGLVMVLGDALGIASFAAVARFMLNWEVIFGASVLVVAALWLIRRR